MIPPRTQVWLWMSFTLSLGAASAPDPVPPLPSPSQLAWVEDELTVFVHFGMNTFTGKGLGLGNEDPNLFNPTRLDCSQWVRVAKECGFKGMILTAKHHDGFCLWPTRTTSHSVASTQWRDGKGDVVRELADACREGGLRFGIYLSPWDRSQANYENDKPAYARLFREQLTELLSNYGPVYEMWFHGNKADLAEWPAAIEVVRRLQPDTIIKQGPILPTVREDVRWVGNEIAHAPLANWNVYPPPDDTNAAERIWFPVECDTMMIGHWFWDGYPPRDLDQLLHYYYVSVGRGSILLLNVAPNPEGLFSEDSVARLREFRAALDGIFNTDLALGRKATASNTRGNDPSFSPDNLLDEDKSTYWATDDGVTNASVEIDLGDETEFNVIRIEEFIRLGQRVAEYQVEAWDSSAEEWKLLNRGFTIGHRKLDRFQRVKSSKVRLSILESRACPVLHSIGVHLDTVSPPEHFTPEIANVEVKPRTRAPRPPR